MQCLGMGSEPASEDDLRLVDALADGR